MNILRLVFSKLPLKITAPILLTVPVLIVVVALSTVAFVQGRSTADDLASQNMRQIHQRIEEHLSRLMDLPPAINELNKRLLDKGQLSLTDVDQNRVPVFETLDIFQAVSSIVIGLEVLPISSKKCGMEKETSIPRHEQPLSTWNAPSLILKQPWSLTALSLSRVRKPGIIGAAPRSKVQYCRGLLARPQNGDCCQFDYGNTRPAAKRSARRQRTDPGPGRCGDPDTGQVPASPRGGCARFLYE